MTSPTIIINLQFHLLPVCHPETSASPQSQIVRPVRVQIPRPCDSEAVPQIPVLVEVKLMEV